MESIDLDDYDHDEILAVDTAAAMPTEADPGVDLLFSAFDVTGNQEFRRKNLKNLFARGVGGNPDGKTVLYNTIDINMEFTGDPDWETSYSYGKNVESLMRAQKIDSSRSAGGGFSFSFQMFSASANARFKNNTTASYSYNNTSRTHG